MFITAFTRARHLSLPLLIFPLKMSQSPLSCVVFRTVSILDSEELLDTRPSTQLEGHPFRLPATVESNKGP